ncbi:hypothetical protein PoB_005708300 [Plakobranchus ocellatus]|uniref:Uncharacterized protein n=1 Tax=Plakobranchus ocellatus TaxID=259542 RepID=A0AAV4CF54_9GAST|nr:hypothetical protein PoB_005708300 [Plakobranchus ocellatus]
MTLQLLFHAIPRQIDSKTSEKTWYSRRFGLLIPPFSPQLHLSNHLCALNSKTATLNLSFLYPFPFPSLITLGLFFHSLADNDFTSKHQGPSQFSRLSQILSS